MFKKILVILCLSFVLVVPGVLARSGCCSGHGGVCGCKCCDGKPLSAVCRQYYEECEDVIPASESRNLSDGWGLALTYAVGVSLFLIFAKMRYKIKKSKN